MAFKLVFIVLLPACFLLPAGSLNAQGKEALYIDSLIKTLPSLPEDTSKVNALCDISFTYFNVNMNEGLRRGNEALALAEKIGWKKGIAKAYGSLGSNYWALGEFVRAQDYYLKSLKINESTGDRAAIAKSLHRVGVSYSSQFDKSKAITYFEKALRLFQEIGDSVAVMGCYLNIGQQYDDLKDFSKVLECYRSALNIAGATQRKRDVAFILNMIGKAYASQGDFGRAVQYAERSVALYQSLGENNELAMQYGNAAEVYLMAGNYNRSINAFKKAIKIFTPVKTRGETSYYGAWYGQIGKIQILLYKKNRLTAHPGGRKILEDAIIHLKKGLVICESITSWPYSEEFHQALAEAYELKGDFALALNQLKTSVLYKDSIFNSQKRDKMVALELEYEYNKRKDSLDYGANLKNIQLINEKRISKLALKEQRLYSIIILVTFCLVSSYFLFQYRVKQLRLKNELTREKAAKQLKETEYQKRINDITFAALRSQMNPHFIFNALNTIQSFVYSNDKISATRYLGKFGELIRKILDNSNKQQISLAEEIHFLQLYIDIEKARFGEMLHASIATDAGIDTEDIYIPPMLVQPYAENAIKHGLLHLAGEKRMLIRISKSKDNQYTEIIIDDNGIGREKSNEINKNRVDHHSFANTANEKRIDLINLLNERKTKLEIIDKKNADGTAAGTTVIISVPMWQTAAV